MNERVALSWFLSFWFHVNLSTPDVVITVTILTRRKTVDEMTKWWVKILE